APMLRGFRRLSSKYLPTNGVPSGGDGATRPRRKVRDAVSDPRRTPSRADPLLILAMDHRESFGRTLFAVEHDKPTSDQVTAMERAKTLIYEGLVAASARLPVGHAGVL